MSLREDKKQRTRGALRAAALRLFAREGFDATTVDQIAAEAGVSRTTFFRYFPTKEAVVFGRSKEIGEVFRRWIAERPPEENPLEAFEGALMALARETRGNVDLARESLEMRAMLERNPGLRKRYAEHTQEQMELVAQALAERDGSPVGTDHRLAAGVGLVVSEEARDLWHESNVTLDVENLLKDLFGRIRSLAARRRRADDVD
ncbi:MAG TPA: TetR family transcriptional regulator [Actinomycetota bacterium]|nr:TetR family transcriptional regulator [Actinomycetota bacterium]